MADIRIKLDDCWNRIGTWSDVDTERRCERLAEVVHCINCDVYTSAGRKLLNRDAPKEYLDEWRQVLAEPEPQPDFESLSMVLFRLHDKWLALPTHLFEQVLGERLIHGVPHNRNDSLLGLVNVRNELVLCVAMDKVIGLNATKGHDTTNTRKVGDGRLIVIKKAGLRWAFYVNEVQGIYRCSRDKLTRLDGDQHAMTAGFAQAGFYWTERPVALLDEDSLVDSLVRMSL
jgi:chemotaxis-related protein WspD